MLILVCFVFFKAVVFSAFQDFSDQKEYVGGSNSHDSQYDNFIQVQTNIYRMPYEQYHPEITKVLKMKLVSYSNPLDEAEWYLSLGIAHRDIADKIKFILSDFQRSDRLHSVDHSDNSFVKINVKKGGYDQKESQDETSYSDMDDVDDITDEIAERHIQQSVRAFQSAIETYNGMRLEVKNNFDARNLDEFIGNAMLYVGEAYDLSERFNHLAIDYYFQAYEIFTKLLHVISMTKEETDGMYSFNEMDVNGDATSLQSVLNERIELLVALCSAKIGNTLLIQYTDDNKPSEYTSHQSPPTNNAIFTLLTENLLNIDFMDLMLTSLFQDLTKLEQLKNHFQSVLTPKNSKSKSQMQSNLQKAKHYLNSSLRIYRKYLRLDVEKVRQNGKSDNEVVIDDFSKYELDNMMVSCLQSLGTIAIIENDTNAAISNYEESFNINLEIVKYYENDKGDGEMSEHSNRKDRFRQLQDAPLSIADALYNLSNLYLQQGKYKEATDRYRRSMEWSEKYSIQLPSTILPIDQAQADDVSRMLQEYEDKLEKYQAKFGENSLDGGAGGGRFYENDNVFFQTQEYYEDEDIDTLNFLHTKKESYEADLHSTLGSLYITTNDLVKASSHLTQAIRLYDLSGEDAEPTMADTIYNLASLYLRVGDFQASADAFDEALGIYQQLFGDGVDPMSLSSRLKLSLEAMGLLDLIWSDASIESILSPDAQKAPPKANDGDTELVEQIQDGKHKESSNTGNGDSETTDVRASIRGNTDIKLMTDSKEGKKTFTSDEQHHIDDSVINLELFLKQNETSMVKDEL